MTSERFESYGMDTLRITILGEPVPAQMGCQLASGKVAASPRVRAYRKLVALLTMHAVRRAGWTASRTDSFAVTARFFVGTARTIDLDNLAKCLLDGLKGVVFPDDRQIYELHLFKSIARGSARTEVEIARLF